MDLHIDKVCVGYIVRSLVNIGIERFKDAWNHHRIPKKGIPFELAEANSKIEPLNIHQLPTVREAIDAYNEIGTMTTNYEYLNAFGDNLEANAVLANLFENAASQWIQ